MSLIPGSRYIRCRQSEGTIGSVAKTLEADPLTPLEYGTTGSFVNDNTKPVYYVANNDTTDNDITD